MGQDNEIAVQKVLQLAERSIESNLLVKSELEQIHKCLDFIEKDVKDQINNLRERPCILKSGQDRFDLFIQFLNRETEGRQAENEAILSAIQDIAKKDKTFKMWMGFLTGFVVLVTAIVGLIAAFAKFN